MLRVLGRVMFASFFGVVHGVNMVTVRDVRVMPGAMMVSLLMMIGRVAMMLRRVFVMRGCLPVMFGTLVFYHLFLRLRLRCMLLVRMSQRRGVPISSAPYAVTP